jgi:hypothetical protein
MQMITHVADNSPAHIPHGIPPSGYHERSVPPRAARNILEQALSWPDFRRSRRQQQFPVSRLTSVACDRCEIATMITGVKKGALAVLGPRYGEGKQG